MRYLLFIIAFMWALTINAQSTDKNVKISTEEDSTTYEIIIIDPGFDFWFKSHAKHKEFYSKQYYENWNSKYVKEWNYRYNSAKNVDIIESYINYDEFTDYGLDLNYQLYWYFQYFEKTNKVSLIRRK